MTNLRTCIWYGFVLVSLSLIATACGSGGDSVPGDGGGTPPPTGDPARLSGRVLFQQGVGGGGILEAEPNDSAFESHYLGYILAGQEFKIHGTINDLAGLDPYDGFQFRARERLQVSVHLAFSTEGGTDLDVAVLEFSTLQYVEVFDTDTAPEEGSFYVKGLFDIVVRAIQGGGAYVLTVSAESAETGLFEEEPNNDSQEAQYLGNVDIGDSLRVTGLGDATSDMRDEFLVACTSPMLLDLGLDHYPPGDDYDLSIWDVSGGLGNPSFMTSFGGGAATPRIDGTAVVGGTRLLAIRVTAVTGYGVWNLTISARFPSAPAPQGLAPAVLASSSAQVSRWRRVQPGEAGYLESRYDMVPGEVLLVASPEEGDSLLKEVEAQGGTWHGDLTHGAARVTFAPPPDPEPSAVNRWTLTKVASLRQMQGTVHAEPNYLCRAFVTPDDDYYNLQWNYPLIHLPEAWEVTTGDSAIIVAVLDTGRTNHPDLQGRQSGGYDFISSTSISLDGDGLDSNPTDPGDQDNPDGSSSFHGTHVAGTIGAATNNGIGVAGVTWNTQIMHLRVLGRGGGTTYDIAQAIRYAAGLSNDSGTVPATRANVINMSLGGGGPSATMASAISAARNAGVVVFAAAGNESSSIPSYPAATEGVISVAAVDVNGNRAWYSNTGSTIDIAAPGGDTRHDLNADGQPDGVLSTLYDDSGSSPVAVYAYYQGTSMACPHAVGVAALVLSIDPTLTPSEVEEILTSTADDLGAPGRDDLYGHGLVNAYAAVIAAQGGGGTDSPPQLSLNPDTLSFAYNVDTLDVRVSNPGGMVLSIQDVSTSTQSGGGWLSAATYGTGDDDQDVDGIRVEVDRSGLDTGIYAGAVTVESNAGTKTVQVLMAARSAPPPLPDVDIFVQLTDALTGDVVEEVKVNPRTGLDFVFEEVPPGTYYLAAGSDLAGDGVICGEDEYCGLYPVSGAPVALQITSGEDRTGLDFPVAPFQPIELAASKDGATDSPRTPAATK